MIFVPDEHSEDWDGWGFEGPRHPCFLCGGAVGEGKVVVWMGSGGTAKFVSESETSDLTVQIVQKMLPVTAALHIYFHPNCVPSFCRRILMDWEQIREAA